MKDRLVVFLVRVLGWLPLAAGRCFGRCIGWLMWRFNTREARVTRANLAICLPELSVAERERLTRLSLIDTGRVGAEIPVVWRMNDAQLRSRLVASEGTEHIEAAVAQGRGLIMLTPHLGNWEVLMSALTQYMHLTTLYQPAKNELLDAYIGKCRTRGRPRAHVAPASRRGVSMMVKALRRGESLGILPDQVPGSGRLQVPFFGEPAQTMTLVHSLIQRTDCEVLMCFALCEGRGFRLVVRPCDPAIRAADPAQSLAAMNRSVEQCIREAPAQYQWEYKRFKGRDRPEPY